MHFYTDVIYLRTTTQKIAGQLGIATMQIHRAMKVYIVDIQLYRRWKIPACPLKAFEGVIAQGFLETSNVNTVQEMVEMISVMRAYESNQKVLTTFDATMEKAATEVGRV